MRKFLFFIVLFCSVCCNAQFSDEQLYKAYLHSDVATWKRYVDSFNWDKASSSERLHFIAYEYGFVPRYLNEHPQQAGPYLDQFEKHVEAVSSLVSPAQKEAYEASVMFYKIMQKRSRAAFIGTNAIRKANLAASQAPKDPSILGLKANAKLNTPAALGGSAQKALEIFQEAERIYEASPDKYKNSWNWLVIEINIVRCYDAMGKKDEALTKCDAILKKWPDFQQALDYKKQHPKK